MGAMMTVRCLLLLVSFVCILGAIDGSEGDADPLYRTCLDQCEKTGFIEDSLIQHCQFLSDGISGNNTWYEQEPLYLSWKKWNCRNDCRYHCMMRKERDREALGLTPVKYHGKWPFKRISVFQEPVSAALSALNFVVQFNGWRSFFLLSYYKLPRRPQSKQTYCEFTGLWHIYGILSMNAWFWSAIFHSREFDLAEKLDYSSAVALLGYSLILAILRTFNVKDEAARVMVAAPLLAFLTTHILYLNFYELDYGLNMKVCVAMGAAQLILWAGWAAVTRHPSKLKLWTIVIGGALGMLLEIYDFPPYNGYVDSHALWHAINIPLSYLWWNFVKEDAQTRTTDLIKKMR